jgi:SAM-dependent methyltransferase
VVCLICNRKTKLKILFTSDRYGINQNTVICQNCGLVFTNPRGTESEYAEFYESNLYRRLYDGRNIAESHDIDLNEDSTRGEFLKFLSKSQIDFKTVIDVGAGYGHKVYQLKKMGKKALGVEPSLSNCLFMDSQGLECVQGFIKDLKTIKKKNFDLIVLSHVLEHLHDPIKSLIEISQIESKYIYIEVPGFGSYFQSIQNAHLYYFSIKSLKTVCSKANLKIIKIEQSKLTNNIYLIAVSKTGSYDYIENKFKNKQEYMNILNRYYKWLLLMNIRNLLKRFGLFDSAKRLIKLIKLIKF